MQLASKEGSLWVAAQFRVEDAITGVVSLLACRCAGQLRQMRFKAGKVQNRSQSRRLIDGFGG